jgi:hypothetical protein
MAIRDMAGEVDVVDSVGEAGLVMVGEFGDSVSDGRIGAGVPGTTPTGMPLLIIGIPRWRIRTTTTTVGIATPRRTGQTRQTPTTITATRRQAPLTCRLLMQCRRIVRRGRKGGKICKGGMILFDLLCEVA